MIKRGYIIEFKRKGPVSFILGGLLKLFARDWDAWGWHLAIIWDRGYNGWYVLEALAGGIEINYYGDKFLAKCARVRRWLSAVPNRKRMGKFLENHINKKYDVAVYFWTSLAIIVRHFWNRPIPKLLDTRFSCWELVAEFCAEMGKPVVSKYDVIIITDMVKALKTNQ